MSSGSAGASYCYICGSKKVPEWTGYYDHMTGEKHMDYVCPKDPCGHSEHDGQKIPFRTWRDFFRWNDVRCRRCGYEWSTY